MISFSRSFSPIIEETTSTLLRLNEWVKIPTDANNQDNIRLLQEMIAADLTRLGLSVYWIENQGKAVLVAETMAAKNNPSITLLGHVDTALPNEGEIRLEGHWAYGVGVGDDKGGVMVGLSALERIGAHKLAQLPLRFVISPNEESGSNGFHEYFRELAQVSTWVLGLEPALKDGNIIKSRCGNRWYHLQYEGIGAHAGRFGEVHANPIHPLAKLVSKLAPLNDDLARRRANATDIKVSPGIINAIPNFAELKVDVRFATLFDQKLLDTIIREAPCEENINVKIELLDDCPPLEERAPAHFYELACSIIGAYEQRQIYATQTGGASDANHFYLAQKGVLDGLGPIARGMHTKEESIFVPSLETRSQALSQLIYKLGDYDAQS